MKSPEEGTSGRSPQVAATGREAAPASGAGRAGFKAARPKANPALPRACSAAGGLRGVSEPRPDTSTSHPQAHGGRHVP